MSGKAGQKNAYYCEACGKYTLTIHRDDGVTPMFLACRASGSEEDCQGRAVSMMYRDVDSAPAHVPKEPAWEWFKPSPSPAKLRRIGKRDPSFAEHLERGGLELRKIAATSSSTRVSDVPHLAGPADCWSCGHTWAAIRPMGTDVLECPECGEMMGAESS